MESSFLKPGNAVTRDDHDGLVGAIFMCNKKTIRDCLQLGLFGLPLSRRKIVEQVVPGTILFLFEYEDRQLHGIFEASSFGGMNIEPNAYKSSGSSFPCQVRCKTLIGCAPLYEFEFKKAIKDNYFSEWKFKFNLTKKQVSMLVDIFIRRIEDSEMNTITNCFEPSGIKHFSDVCEQSNEIIRENTVSLRNGAARDLLTDSKYQFSLQNENELNNTHCNGNLTSNVFKQDYYLSSDARLGGLCYSHASVVGSIDVCSTPQTADCNLHHFFDGDKYISPEKHLPMEMNQFSEQSVQHTPVVLSRPRVSLYGDATFFSSMDHRECLVGPNLILLHSDVTYPGSIIGESDRLVENEDYHECEHLPSSVKKDKNHKGFLSLEQKKANDRVSVWSRISAYKGCMDGYSANEEQIIELSKDNAADVLEAEAVVDDIETADTSYERENNLFNFARKKTLASTCDFEEKDHNNLHKRRRKLIRPDFSASAESHNQSSKGISKAIEAIEENECSKQIVAEVIMHSNNNRLQHETNEEKLIDFDLNQSNIVSVGSAHLFPSITDSSSSELDSSEQVLAKKSTVMPEYAYLEADSNGCPFSLTIGLNSHSSTKLSAGSLHNQCDTFNRRHLHVAELNLHEASFEKDSTLISAASLDMEKLVTPEHDSLATGVISQKLEIMKDHSSVKILNNICAKEQSLHEDEISPSMQRNMGQPICLNFLNIETPFAIEPQTSGVSPIYLQDYFVKGEQSETNIYSGKEEESVEVEPGRTVGYCNQLNILHNGASGERETEVSALTPLNYAVNSPKTVSECLCVSELNLTTPSIRGGNIKTINLDASIPIDGKRDASEEVFGSVTFPQKDPLQDELLDALDTTQFLDPAVYASNGEASRKDTVFFQFI